MRIRSIVICLFLVCWTEAAWAELCKWVDSAGREQFVDDIAKVPSEYQDRVKKIDPAALQISGQSLRNDDSPTAMQGRARKEDSGQEEKWRKQAEDLRRKIKLHQDDLEFYYGLQRDCRESQRSIISPRNRDCGRLHAENIQRIKENLEELRKELDVDLPEEARRAGASPGWLRESSTSTRRQEEITARDEHWWRNRAHTLREQLRTEQGKLNRYYDQEQKCEEEQRYNTGCKKKNCKVMYESRIKHAERRVTNLRQSLEVDLPEEARRAGAYPGWLRE